MKKFNEGTCYCPTYILDNNGICIYCKTKRVDNLNNQINERKKKKKNDNYNI